MLKPGSGNADGYLPRYLDEEIEGLLAGLPALSIDGPKGVGKTETASRHVNAVLPLDFPETRQLIELDTRSQLQRADRVCVDEWQKYPPVWDAVRRLVDEGSATRFILTGSATPAAGANTHSGAGRIISLRMRPLALAERRATTPTIALADVFSGNATIAGETPFAAADYAREICASGLPGINPLAPRFRRAALQGYIERLIDRDVPELGTNVRHPAAMRAWLRAYAAASSTTAAYSTLLNAATPGESDKPARSTMRVYRELLARLWILEPIPAWAPALTPLSRLTKGDKHQLCDPGLAAHLLGITEEKLLSGTSGAGEIFGRLFESLATLSLRAAATGCEAQVFHLRTRDGVREVDLVVERYDGAVVACEVKLARVIDDRDVRHLNWLGEQIGERLVDKLVLTAGQTAYRRPDGVAVVPLALLG
ncbi:ATP-binding protein [Actinomyces sp. MRS3W]|uniref:ATP-binding protein n=1 Tax=Actinomyces sp. MRS3W TaxID=2800796 RepID=UPI0028FD169D|nr:DUF4143 domain-containing protein [Actinomyces sp. MRS3W]MDU0348739.1 DUF4143 domain-containing protein [Actinomyces sp. MRS3W]